MPKTYIMPAISPALQSVLNRVTPQGISEDEVHEVLREVRSAAQPVDTMRAIFSGYGDQFTARGIRALETAAVVVGDDALAGILKSFATEGSAVTKARSTVSTLRREISALETQHTTAKTKVDSLVGQIESRKTELKRQREKKRRQGIIFAFYGYSNAAAVSLVTMINDDSRIQSLNRELSAAKSKQDSAQRDIEQYKATKSKIEGRLAVLTQAESGYGTASADLPARTPQKLVNVVSARAMLSRRENILKNLKEQVQLLTTLRDSAASVSANLDRLVSELQTVVTKAESLVKESQQELHDLMNIAVAKDPEAAAQKWLKKKVTAAQKKVFKDLNLDMNAYVKRLVAQAVPDGGPAAQLLQQQLSAAIKDQLQS